MKLRIALLALIAAAGVTASVAVAKPPSGHGNPHNQAGSTTGTTATGTTGTTTTTSGHGKGKKAGTVLVCHKTGNGKYVLVRVSANSALAKGKRPGDVLAVGGTCPGPIQGHTGTGTDEQGTTTTTTSTTATTTTTAATTTS